MDASDQVVGYVRSAFVRWTPAALAVASMLASIGAAAVTGEAWALPVRIGAFALSAVVAASLFATSGVTISPTALIVVSPRGRSTMPWPDIRSIQARGSVVWVMCGASWHALPLPAHTVASSGSSRGQLGPEIWTAWLERRGADWRAEGMAPWTPVMDLRGRVVLRPPVEGRILTALMVFWLLIGDAIATTINHLQNGGAPTDTMTGPRSPLWFNLAVLAITIAVAAAVHWWSRVAIDEETWHIRTVRHNVRIPRASIIGVREVAGRLSFDQRLAIDHRAIGHDGHWITSSTTLPGPASSTRFSLHDPGFYAKWTWLHDQLTVAPDPASSTIDDDPT